jgi:hypothetical protein
MNECNAMQCNAIVHFLFVALLGHNFDIKKCEEMIKRTDADNDGKVGFEDFSKMLKSTRPLRLRRRSFRSNSPCKNQHRDKNNNNQNPMNPITTMPTTVEQKKRRLSLNLDEDSSFKHLNLEIIEARASKINIQLNPLPSITTDPKTMENVQQILSLNNNHSNHNHNHNNNNNVDPTSCSSTSQRSSVRRSKSFCGSMRNNKEIAEIELEIEMEAAAEPESQNTAALPEISMV